MSKSVLKAEDNGLALRWQASLGGLGLLIIHIPKLLEREREMIVELMLAAKKRFSWHITSRISSDSFIT